MPAVDGSIETNVLGGWLGPGDGGEQIEQSGATGRRGMDLPVRREGGRGCGRSEIEGGTAVGGREAWWWLAGGGGGGAVVVGSEGGAVVVAGSEGGAVVVGAVGGGAVGVDSVVRR
jgi:hypothetical protein